MSSDAHTPPPGDPADGSDGSPPPPPPPPDGPGGYGAPPPPPPPGGGYGSPPPPPGGGYGGPPPPPPGGGYGSPPPPPPGGEFGSPPPPPGGGYGHQPPPPGGGYGAPPPPPGGGYGAPPPPPGGAQGQWPPPPPPRKPSSSSSGCLKWGLIGCGGLILIAILIGVGSALWFSKHGDELMAGAETQMQEGAEFGAGTDEAGCMAEVRNRLQGDQGLASAVKAKLWQQECLKSSRSTPGFCDGVPRATEFMKSARWQTAECTRQNLSRGSCQTVMQTVQEYCAQGRPKASASDITWPDDGAGPADGTAEEPIQLDTVTSSGT